MEATWQKAAEISIHALREEGDVEYSACSISTLQFLSTPSARRATRLSGLVTPHVPISIHALREEGDHDLFHSPGFVYEFLSTPSARRATGGRRGRRRGARDFYPRPPRGGRRATAQTAMEVTEFLSTPSARRATRAAVYRFNRFIFLSTPSARRATGTFHGASRNTPYFYPRPPRGGRPARFVRGGKTLNFYPRPPRGGRPKLQNVEYQQQKISIHALREEGDRDSSARCIPKRRFLSTPSARRATQARQRNGVVRLISIHALREEGDRLTEESTTSEYAFLSTPSARRATHSHPNNHYLDCISIHALREEGDCSHGGG